jgi:hypothetical protein
MKKVQLIKWPNGAYSIGFKTSFLFWSWTIYLDLVNNKYKWSSDSQHFKDCLTNDFDKANNMFNYLVKNNKVLSEGKAK